MRNASRTEVFIYTVFFISFTALAGSQIALLNPEFREQLVWQDQMEGTLLGKEVSLFESTSIKLQLVSKADTAFEAPDVKVLINGETRAAFIDGAAEIKAASGDLIEIDGSDAPAGFSGVIKVISGSVEDISQDDDFTVENRVKPLGRVGVSK
jgi:hypothetical protein